MSLDTECFSHQPSGGVVGEKPRRGKLSGKANSVGFAPVEQARLLPRTRLGRT